MTKKNSDTIEDNETFDKFDTENDPYNLTQNGLNESSKSGGNNVDSWDIDSLSKSPASSSSPSQEFDESISVDDDTLAEATELMRKRREFQKIATEYKCEIIGIGNAITGAIAGSILGTVQGIATNHQHFGKNGYSRLVLQSSASNAANFGAWLGIFSYSKCSLIGLRKKNDLFNTFGGGFMAGALVSVHSRSATKMITSGLISGTLMTLMESISL